MKKNSRLPEGMNPEKKNKITRDLMMGLIFDPTSFAGEKAFSKLHDIARRAGISDDEFDVWRKELLQERNLNLSVIPARVVFEVDENEICWVGRGEE